MNPVQEIQTTSQGKKTPGQINRNPKLSPIKGKKENEKNKPTGNVAQENEKKEQIGEKDEEYEFMVNGPPNYWQDLAEERRIAVVATLFENVETNEVVEHLRSKLKKMTERCVLLEERVKVKKFGLKIKRPFREIKTTAHGEKTLAGRSNKRPQASPKKGEGNVQEKEQNKLIDRENAKQNSNEFMVNGIIPDNYWEKLAEERRIDLEDVLDEKKHLFFRVLALERNLKKMVWRAKLLEQWRKELPDDIEDDDTEERRKLIMNALF